MSRRVNVPGTIYLLCFRDADGAPARYRHAAHYLGFTENLDNRIAEHRSGHGARLMAVIKAAGLTFEVTRTWPGDRREERRLKNRGGHTRLCPCCNPRVRMTQQQGEEECETSADTARGRKPRTRTTSRTATVN